MSRRLKSKAVRGLLAAVEEAVKSTEPEPIKAVDSKPLVVSIVSKDADARWGKTTRKTWSHGYKLHVVWGRGTMPVAWRVTGLNAQDGRAAAPLLRQLTGRGVVLGDVQYDHNARYEDAAAHGHQLLALHKKNAGRGHRPQSPHRLRGWALTRHFQAWVRRERARVERSFGGLTCSAGGLGHLPAWVRGLERVTRWVQAKLVVNALRLRQLQKQQLAMA